MVWGWEVDRVYQDLGKREQLQQLLQDCETEAIHYLLIRRLEELGDSVSEVCLRLSQLETLGIQIITIESATPRTDFLKLLHEIQTHQRSRRIRQGHARNRLEAKPPPGKAPYGYKRSKNSYIVDRRTAPVVKEFFEQFLLFGSLRGAVRHLEKKYGKKISVTTGRRWLTNPVYRGNLTFANQQTLLDTHEPILTREEAAQVDRLLRRNQRLPSRTASAPRSLAGLVRCGECQSSLSVSRVTTYGQDREYLYLRSPNCPKHPACKAVAYEEVLQETITAICRDLKTAIAHLTLPDLERVKADIQARMTTQQDILQQIPHLTASGILDPETAQIRTYKLRTAIAQLQAQLSQLPPVNLRSVAEAVSIPQFWLDLSEAERRFYFREFIQHIELHRQDSQTWHLKLIFIF